MQRNPTIGQLIVSFLRDEDGASTIAFMLALPVFVFLFTMAFEFGILSTRQVMLEHGLNETVRQVRIGNIRTPTHAGLITEVCKHAGIIPDCANQLRLEMIATSVPGLDPAVSDPQFECRDRNLDATTPLTGFTNTGLNNELMVLRVCALFDPLMPGTAIGQRVVEEEGAGYALVAASGYVLEPYR